MFDFNKLYRTYKDKLENYFKDDNSQSENKKLTLVKQWKNLAFIIVIGFFLFLAFLVFVDYSNKPRPDQIAATNEEENQKIVLATDATSAESKRFNFLEEKVEEEGRARAEEIQALKDSMHTNQAVNASTNKNELENLRASISHLMRDIEKLKSNNQNLQNDIASLSGDSREEIILPAELGITAIGKHDGVSMPVSSHTHIPATSYVSGHLLGGIAVSTSVNSASEPIPVIIKLTGRGNLPKDLAVNVKDCRLLASCYGDISSERAIVRAEELICENRQAGLYTATKVSGVIYGDDGANGIRGTVVSMSDKHLKNALVGGVLSGFAGTAKGKEGVNLSALGVIGTKSKGMKDMAQDGIMNGASSAAEKLADYHIKLAENISPVILVSGGTKVDVVFTKTVQIGSSNVDEIIKAERVGQ